MLSHTQMGVGGAVLVALLLCASTARANDGDTVPLSPEKAVAFALATHPDIRAASAALQTAEGARSASALFLTNPQASAWVAPGAARAELAASQPLSLTGEGRHAHRAAGAQARSGEAALSRARRRIAAEVRLAYIDAAIAIGRTSVASEGAELAARLRFAVTRKHEEGEASALELRLAHLYEVQAAARLLAARKDEVEALRVLSEAIAAPVAATDLEDDPIAAAPFAGSEVSTDRIDVMAARNAVEAARAGLARQRAAQWAPVSVGVGLSVEDGQAFVGPSVSVPVSVFDRNQVGVARARGDLSVAEGRLAALEARVEVEQRTARERTEEAEQLTEALTDDPLDEARAAIASIEAGVRAGEIELSTAVLLAVQVLDGEAAIFTSRGLLADARVDLLLAMDDDRLLGGAP